MNNDQFNKEPSSIDPGNDVTNRAIAAALADEGFDINDIASNIDEEVNGRWFDFKGGSKVKVARVGNPNFNDFVRRKYKEYRVTLDADDKTANDKMNEIMKEAYALHILKDVQKFKGIPAYTPAKGLELLQHRNFFDAIKALTENQDAFLLNREDAAVNS